MNVFLKCVVSVLLAFFVFTTAIAEKADDSKMASEALAPILSSKMPHGEKQARVQESHAIVRTRASTTPEREMLVTAVFNKGLSIKKLDALAKKYDLEIVDMHLKAPYDESGAIQSFDVGAIEMARYRGDFAARANKAIGAIRYRLLTMAETMPPDVSKAYNDIARQELRVYRIEAYSRAQAMAEFVDHFDVALITALNQAHADQRISNHRQMRTRAIDTWKRAPSDGARIVRLRVGDSITSKGDEQKARLHAEQKAREIEDQKKQ